MRHMSAKCTLKMSQKWNWNIFKLQLSVNLKAELWAFQYSNIQNVILQYCHFTLHLITLQLFTEIYCVSSLGDFSHLPPSQEGKAQKDSSSLHPVSHPPETPKVPQKFPYFRMNHERLLTTLSNWKFSDVAWRLCHLSTPLPVRLHTLMAANNLPPLRLQLRFRCAVNLLLFLFCSLFLGNIALSFHFLNFFFFFQVFMKWRVSRYFEIFVFFGHASS